MTNGRLSIAHVTEAFAGGVITYMTLMLSQLKAHGHDVTLFCSDGRRDPRFDEAVDAMSRSGVAVRTLPMRRSFAPWADAREAIRLRREFKNGRYDLVHTHGTKAGLIGRLAARLVGVPAVHTPHCYAFLRAGTRAQALLIRLAERAMTANTAGLIAVCPSEMGIAVTHGLIDPRRCTVISNGLPDIDTAVVPDRTRARQTFGLSPSAWVVTMAARLVDYKGIGLFLEIAKRCRDMNVVFVLAGHGEREAWVREQVDRLGLADHVRVVGHVRDVPSLLAASDICVLCSVAEGQPYILLEAMRGGCAIVATDGPGIADMLEDGKTALLTRRDAGELALAIRRLAGDELLRTHLVARARERFLEAHQLGRQVDALTKAYEMFRENRS